MRRVPLAWLQLRRERVRLAVAIAGVCFGVVLIFVQLGFQDALYQSSVRYHDALGYDLAVISPKTDYLVQPVSFPRVRLFQLPGYEGVEAVSPVLVGLGRWRHPTEPAETRAIFVVGFDPDDRGFDLPGVAGQVRQVRKPDRVLFDRHSRVEYGPVQALFEAAGSVETEVNDRTIAIVGLFELGTSFGIDGSLLTSDLNFRRIFPDRAASHVDLGLVHLEPGADPAAVRDAIRASLPADVLVLTRGEFIEREIAYWSQSTAIGWIFGFGVAVGFVVGLIIVYQILFADVLDSLRAYATLKAMGYTHRSLVGVVLREAVLLAFLGYVPALAITLWVYRSAGTATHLPMVMTWERGLGVLAATLVMCCVSAVLAIRKLRGADPAEVF